MSSQAGKVTYCQRVCKCDPQRGKGIEKGPGVGSLLCTDVNLKIRHICKFSSVQFSCSVVSDSLWPHESQHARPPCPSPTPGVHSDSVHWVGDAIQPSHPLSSLSSPAPNPSQHQSLFQWVNSSHEVAKVGLICKLVNSNYLYFWKGDVIWIIETCRWLKGDFHFVLGLLFSRFSHVQLFCNPMGSSPPGSSVHGIL